MKTFICTADVQNIYNNGENFIQREYRAKDEKSALQGFTQYLECNPHLTSFENVTVKEV